MEILSKRTWWALSGLWAVVIYSLSGPSYSAAESAGFIARLAAWLAISFLRHHASLVNLLLRKGAHLTEYAIFAVFLYGSIKPAGKVSWSNPSALLALSASAAYSLTDEFYQVFVPGRHASLVDCLLDTTGAFIGLFVFFRMVLMAYDHARGATSLAS